MLIAARLQRRARRPLASPELPSVSFPKTSGSPSLVPICRGAHIWAVPPTVVGVNYPNIQVD
jgi:hypothetical protein